MIKNTNIFINCLLIFILLFLVFRKVTNIEVFRVRGSVAAKNACLTKRKVRMGYKWMPSNPPGDRCTSPIHWSRKRDVKKKKRKRHRGSKSRRHRGSKSRRHRGSKRSTKGEKICLGKKCGIISEKMARKIKKAM